VAATEALCNERVLALQQQLLERTSQLQQDLLATRARMEEAKSRLQRQEYTRNERVAANETQSPNSSAPVGHDMVQPPRNVEGNSSGRTQPERAEEYYHSQFETGVFRS